jgi:hypothetical protein
MAWREQYITLEDAKAIVARDRHIMELEYSRGFSFSAEKINPILAQQSCIGIRIYLGKIKDPDTEKFVDTLVVVGVQGDTDHDPPDTCNDMHSGLIAEYGYSTHEKNPVRDSAGSPLASD